MEVVLVIFVVLAILVVLSAVGLLVIGFRLARGVLGGLFRLTSNVTGGVSRLASQSPHPSHRRGAVGRLGSGVACPRPGCHAGNATSARYCRRCGSAMNERYDQTQSSRRQHAAVRRAVA